jgi:hypothetical protein
MPNTPNVQYNEVDLTSSIPSPALGITLFIGSCKRGKIGNPDTIFTSWTAFRKAHGGLVSGNNFPLGVKRAIERGSAARVCNVKHYTDVAAGTLAGTKSTAASSAMVALSTALGAAHTITVTVNSTANVQAFSVSSENTLFLLCAKIKLLTGVVQDAYSQGNNSIIIIPKAGITLTVTAGVTGASAPTATVTTEATFEDSSNNTLFALTPKYIGADYDNLIVKVTAATNGDTSAFNIEFIHLLEPDLSEKYENLKIIGTPTAGASTYLAKIVNDSYFFDVTYSDLSAVVSAQIVPRKFAIRYQSGSDGGSIVDADYIGDSASKTGLYSADQLSDISQLSVPEINSVAVLQAGSAYATARKDLQYFGYLGNFTTESALVTARDNTSIDTKYCQLYAQNILVVNPTDSTAADISLSPIYDVCGAADYSDTKYYPWYSFAGKARGKITQAKSVEKNFATNGNTANLNMIAQRQVNIIANKSGTIYILGNFTAQKDLSQYSYGNVTRFIIYLKKSLGPFIESFIEEPNDIVTWKTMYLGAKPTLDDWASKRALTGEENVGWRWEGDQFAKSINDADLSINNATDVGLGKYQLNIYLKVIAALQEIKVGVVLTPSGVSFEDAVDITSPTN